MGQVEQLGIQLLTAICLAAVSVAAAYVTKWLNQHIKDKELLRSIQATNDVVFNAVRGQIQLMDKETEAALADGHLDNAELEKIKKVAVEDFKAHVAPELQKRLQAHVQDAETYVAKQAAATIQALDKVTN